MINLITTTRYKVNTNNLKKHAQDFLTSKTNSDAYVLNVVFVGKRKMKELALKYKNEDVALPVLTFSYWEEQIKPENVIGEIVICYPQAILLAAEREKTVENMMKQLITHGIENIFK